MCIFFIHILIHVYMYTYMFSLGLEYLPAFAQWYQFWRPNIGKKNPGKYMEALKIYIFEKGCQVK